MQQRLRRSLNLYLWIFPWTFHALYLATLVVGSVETMAMGLPSSPVSPLNGLGTSLLFAWSGQLQHAWRANPAGVLLVASMIVLWLGLLFSKGSGTRRSANPRPITETRL